MARIPNEITFRIEFENRDAVVALARARARAEELAEDFPWRDDLQELLEDLESAAAGIGARAI